jgi:adhesin transport system membrane fusion protein
MSVVTSELPQKSEDWAFVDDDGKRLRLASQLVLLLSLLFLTLGIWAYFATLDEVSTGDGRIVPSSREQIIQSLEGGILVSLLVKEDDVVEAGQILAQLDLTKSEASVEESASKYRAALAAAARLQAEVDESELIYPSKLNAYPELVNTETQIFNARRSARDQALHWIDETLALLGQEMKLNQDLSKIGAASNVEVIRLKRQLTELELKKVEVKTSYIVRAREELAKTNAEVTALSPIVSGKTDSLSKLTHRSPVRGVVKNVEVSTIGGVIPPNGKLMEIIPLGDELLVEARISPRDIAYIHPGQPANVKISAYDYAIYGSLDGTVTTISPDTIQDEVDRQLFYYRVFIKTELDALSNTAGQKFPIVPGMVATVDIHTGKKTVLEYIIKPFNKAREALRER